jgi:hypothetical protein
MGGMDLSLLMGGVERRAGSAVPAVRLVLCAGEVLSLPRRPVRLRVLAGTAWVTRAGLDIVLRAGECLELAAGPDSAVLSALGAEPLLVEARA